MTLYIALQAGAESVLPNLIFMGGLFAVAYFFFIRPQAKRQKEQQEFILDLKKGDEVITNGGIIGKISKIDDTELVLQTTEKSFIRVMRTAVSKDFTSSHFIEENA